MKSIKSRETVPFVYDFTVSFTTETFNEQNGLVWELSDGIPGLISPHLKIPQFIAGRWQENITSYRHILSPHIPSLASLTGNYRQTRSFIVVRDNGNLFDTPEFTSGAISLK